MDLLQSSRIYSNFPSISTAGICLLYIVKASMDGGGFCEFGMGRVWGRGFLRQAGDEEWSPKPYPPHFQV